MKSGSSCKYEIFGTRAKVNTAIPDMPATLTNVFSRIISWSRSNIRNPVYNQLMDDVTMIDCILRIWNFPHRKIVNQFPADWVHYPILVVGPRTNRNETRFVIDDQMKIDLIEE